MKTIVIAPNEAKFNLYALYRKDNPFRDIKFYSLEQFLNEANYQSDDRSLIYLIKEHDLSIDEAKEYLSFIRRIKIDKSNNPKIQKLIAYQKELLDQNLLFKNEYFEYELKNAQIDIYYYSKFNKELMNIIQDKHYEFKSFSNLKVNTVYNFANNIDELSFVFNKISELISNGVKASDIYLYGLKDDDELVYLRLKDNYHLNFNNAYRKNYLSKMFVSRFINEYLYDEDIVSKLDEFKDDEIYPEFLTILEKYKIEGISKNKQLSIYKSIFKSKYIPSLKYVEAVNIVNKPISKDGGYLFIINFTQGNYPSLVKDVAYLNNAEKLELGLNTSEDENAANLEQFSEYLRQNANIFVSFSNRSYSEKYYPSPLIKLLNLEVNNKAIIQNYYSLEEAKLTYANLEDLRRNYLDNNPLLTSFKNSKLTIPYRLYDYRYHKVIHYMDSEVLKLSYSSAKTYNECKFKYYLDRVLKLDECETTFSMNVGNLGHAIFERLDEDKSFEQIYEEELKKIDSFSGFDFVYLRRIKKEIQRSFEYIKQFENQIKNKNIERETSGTYSNKPIKLDDNTYLTGKIDKLINFGDNHFAIIDYKTGSEKYEEGLVEYGFSLQLPTYALIASKGDRFEGKKLAGLFIQKFIASSAITSQIDFDKSEKPLLSGVYLDDPNVIAELDTSLSTSPSNYIYSCKLVSSGGFAAKNRNRSEQYFDEISKIAEAKLIETSKGILANDFEINPKIIKGQNKSCSYCPYRDICYRNEKSYVIYSTEGEEENGDN